MEFQYNFLSSKSKEEQWELYLRSKTGMLNELQKNIVYSSKCQTNDISLIIKQQTSEMNDTLQRSSKEQVEAIVKSTEIVCGTLENGFNLLSSDIQSLTYGVDDLKCELNDMASMLDWNFSLLIEHNKVSNLLLGNISKLLRIPEIQKERQYYIEQGIKFLKNAFFDGDFYDDSLINLLKAEQIEPTDFFTLHNIGLIYMFSPKHLDLNKAEKYFSKAAKYAFGETNLGAIVTTNFLSTDLNGNLSDQTKSKDRIKVQAAESFLFAARSCYIQGKLNESAEFASKGFNLLPQMIELGFIQAKALTANNNEKQAIIILEKVINSDRYYSLKTLNDPDLCTNHEVQLLLNKLQRETTEEAKNRLQECNKIQISHSQAVTYLASIEQLINQNTYLTSKKAIDLFDNINRWNYAQPLQNPNQVNYFNELFEITCTFNSLPLSQKGNNTFQEELSKVTQWDFRVVSNISDIKSHSVEMNVIDFLKQENEYNRTLPLWTREFKIIVADFVAKNNDRESLLEKRQIAEANRIAEAEIKLQRKQKRDKIWNGIGKSIVFVIKFALSLVIASVIFLVFLGLGFIFFYNDFHNDTLKSDILGGVFVVLSEIIAWIIVSSKFDDWFGL